LNFLILESDEILSSILSSEDEILNTLRKAKRDHHERIDGKYIRIPKEAWNALGKELVPNGMME